jgi:hypothetical protein
MTKAHPRSYGILAISDDPELFSAPPTSDPRTLLEEAASMGWPRLQLEAWVVHAPEATSSGMVRGAQINPRRWVDVEVGASPYMVAKDERLLQSQTIEGLHPEYSKPRVLLVSRGKASSKF